MNRLLTLLLGVSCFVALGQYEVGDAGPAGGWVFFVDENDEFDDWDYLEVWPHTFSFFQMLVCDTSPFLSSADLGSGESNTNTFTTDDDTFSAFDFATLFDGGGREDWFVPSKSELEILNASAVSELINSGEGYEAVASSTGFNCNWYTFDTEGGWSTQEDLFSWLRVLPVRSFQVTDEGTKCGPGTTWDQDSGTCEVANVSDTDFDGCVGINDFLVHLSNFGSGCGLEPAWACGNLLEYQGYEYETVQIGEQCWFAENLRAEYYRNGDELEELYGLEWVYSSEGAFQQIEGNGEKLYNWYATIDFREVCPTGWSVSSDDDWLELELFIGIQLSELSTLGCRGENEGDHLKSLSWGGSDIYGFGAEPSGLVQSSNGTQWSFDFQAQFWTSTAHSGGPNYDFDSGYGRELSTTNECVYRYVPYPQMGASVRCVKDSE